MEKTIAWGVFAASLVFFVLGFVYPIMNSEILLGIKKDAAYLLGSIRYFYKEGDYFIGSLILIFSIIFPILKYLVVASKIAGLGLGSQKWLNAALEIISKWAMLDVFVVALVIVNMKFDKVLISTTIGQGTVYFAISILLLIITTSILQNKKIAVIDESSAPTIPTPKSAISDLSETPNSSNDETTSKL